MSLEPQTETLSFEAEVKQLLHLVTHSLYSHPEIFLRELISNASDAVDKLRYEALSDAALFENDAELKIWIDFNKDAKTITIRDNGIGMSREEVIENLGTIAHSGTRAFKDKLTGDQSKDAQLIGQFGVGFYSAFVVAERVEVRTRRAGMQPDQGVVWESRGDGSFTVHNQERRQRGTEIVMHLKTDAESFLDDAKLRSIIRKYSDHIALPIVMKKPETDEDRKRKDQGEIVVRDEEVVNRANALWMMPKSEITQEAYEELYKHIAHDFEAPLAWAHNKVEGKLEYTSLLYIPKRAPFDLWQRDMRRGLKLYVKRVFIMDDAENLLPTYLRFVRGVIDSNDLPLNVSRELLQSSDVIDKMKAGAIKRILTLLEQMSKDEPEKYQTFWGEFGQVLKEGPAEDHANREQIGKLLRFASTHADTDAQVVSLADYVGRMKPEQKKIYYVIGEQFAAAKQSPLLEVFRKKGIEVLLLSDRVDEWLMGNLGEWEGKQLQSVAKGVLDLDELADAEEKKAQETQAKTMEPLVKRLKDVMGETVKDIRITHRLTDSPACVVFDEHDLSGSMQRLLAAAGQNMFPKAKPIFELNPEHPLIVRMNTESDDTRLKRWGAVMLNQALLAEGEPLEDPIGFVKELNALLLETNA